LPELYHLPGFYEPFSAMSHLLGAGVFLVLGVLLLRRGRGDSMRLLFLGIYVFSCVLLLSLSGVFHMMVRGSTARLVLERLDHGAIFVLIAGTFTPAHGILFRGWLRWGPLILIWAVAITGITLKSIFLSDLPEWLGLGTYLAMGWIGLGSALLLARRFGFRFIKPLLIGGVAYSLGAIVEFLGWRVVVAGVIHPHEILHLAVLIGAFFHYLFVWQFAAGVPPQLDRLRSPTRSASDGTAVAPHLRQLV
jgi:channel protein (hemolysin III family)